IALVRVGEETGLVDEMLLKVAAYFESDVEAAIATLGAVIEPALIAGLGCVVGFIVFSVFIPLYALIQEVSK
ncbi:MAG TPA: type II secretion system F family protein, partial [Candidatus Elarobacter sp.]|nr:type II secretion system F family protein [Candidatus Elarobacter sp.]